ncbi:MAG TPA: DUF2768 domain-containing protein [Bacillus bacterium]|nr:DUF2768 domain-containing protein [Bacillus sp. (in: firmicutes)]
MSPSLLKMYVSFFGMGFMILSLFAIYLSRFKFNGILKIITAIIAYLFMILAGLIIFFVVFSGPTSE